MMAGLLSHALAAMAFSAFLGTVFGLPSISYGVFLAGFLAMIIELDVDELSKNKRSPIGHSIFFGLIWMISISILVWITIGSSGRAKEMILALISAYTTHLLIDSFTKEGIYTFPRCFEVKRWFMGLSKGDSACWECWHIFENKRFKNRLRGNDDPILNACVSLPSLLVIIVFVAMMPPV
jgi:membrane-bound metal-dependent hydrolase YbcI (DUF457 family)